MSLACQSAFLFRKVRQEEKREYFFPSLFLSFLNQKGMQPFLNTTACLETAHLSTVSKNTLGSTWVFPGLWQHQPSPRPTAASHKEEPGCTEGCTATDIPEPTHPTSILPLTHPLHISAFPPCPSGKSTWLWKSSLTSVQSYIPLTSITMTFVSKSLKREINFENQ